MVARRFTSPTTVRAREPAARSLEPRSGRRRAGLGRSFAVVLATSLATSLAKTSHAQGVDALGAYGPSAATQSDQRWAFELRVGPYTPDVDSEVSGSPYQDTFGDDTRFAVGFELDFQALRIPYVGSFGPGVGLSYTRATAKARFAESGERSEQDTSLWVLPMYVAGVLRADVLSRKYSVPLVPYVKLGVGYALWQIGDADEVAELDDGTVGSGTSLGFQYALGAMFLLDVIEPEGAKHMDASVGVNNAYLFAEYFSSHLGYGDQLRVGTSTWVAGLALEF